LTGYSAEEFQSRPFAGFIHEDDREMVMDRHLQRLRGENPPERYGFRVFHKNGKILWAELNVVLIQWNQKPAALCFMTDITERKQMETRLMQDQKLESIGSLAGGIAHDLVSGAYAMLSVSDTGTGIDPAIMDKIFDPYFTTKTKGRGTGLGLATVYGIVKAFGGDIRVDSEVGEGSCFHVYLPVQEISEPPEMETQPRPLPTGTEHILLVDDEASVVHLEKQMLERLGYRTTSFTDSRDALAAFEMAPSRFDLVITDMHMPELTGLQLAEEMIAVRPDLPVILCTGFSERINTEKIGAMGIRDLLMKPVGMMDLAHKIREVLDE
jgi:PAS domain S-box-containing protein